MTGDQLFNLVLALIAVVGTGIFGLLAVYLQHALQERQRRGQEKETGRQSLEPFWEQIVRALFVRHFLKWFGALLFVHAVYCIINLVLELQNPGPLTRHEAFRIALFTVAPIWDVFLFCYISLDRRVGELNRTITDQKRTIYRLEVSQRAPEVDHSESRSRDPESRR